MNPVSCKSIALALSMGMLLMLAGCNRPAADRLQAGAGSTKRDVPDAGRDSKAARSSAASARTASTDANNAGRAKSETDSTRVMGAAAEKVDDAAITARVNASLARDKDLSAIRIDVDTQDGVVTLSGLAPSAAAKEHASEVAHQVAGVQSVNNQLTIKSS